MFINTIKNRIGLAAIAIISLSNASKAATVYTSNVASGNWSTTSNWTKTGSGTPVKYLIAAGHSITLDVNVSNIDTLWVAGTFNMANNKTISVNNNGTVILDWGGTIQGGSNNTAFILIGSSFTVNGPFTSSNIITSGPRWLTASSATAASGNPQGSFAPLVTLLPVALGSVSVEQTGADFQLTWTALGEANQSTFTVEVSENGTDFTIAGTIAGSNELTVGHYAFNLGNQNHNFYVRLSETNANGNTAALAVKYVSNTNNHSGAFQIFPNLIQNNSNINMVIPTAGNYQVAVYNMNMQLTATTAANTNSDNEVLSFNSVDWNLNSGNYVVVVTGNNGQVHKTRIVVK